MSGDTWEAAMSPFPAMVMPRHGDRLPVNCATTPPVEDSYAIMGPSGELVRITSWENIIVFFCFGKRT